MEFVGDGSEAGTERILFGYQADREGKVDLSVDSLISLREQLLVVMMITKVNWRIARSMIEEVFRYSGIEFQVCCYNPRVTVP